MRLSFLSAFPPYRGGISRFSAELVRELRKQHEVSAFTFTRQYPGVLFPGSTQVDRNAQDEVRAERSLDSIAPWTWSRTAARMAAGDPEIAVLRYWMPFFAPSFGTVARRLRARGTKVISIVDNAVPHEPKFYDRPFTRWFLQQNDGFIAMTERVQQDVLALRPDARIQLHPHPLYDHFGAAVERRVARERLGLPTDARVLLFFGLIRPYKGLDLLIDAFARLDERYHLVIAGEPYGDAATYTQAIDAHPLRANIHPMLRYIDDREVPELFSAADTLVLPYKSATQSGVTAIAYHFGVPVVATNVGGLAETVHHGRTGTVVEPNAAAIAAGISDLFEGGGREGYRNHIAALRNDLSWSLFAEELVNFARGL